MDINNKRDFFKNLKLDEQGNIIVVFETGTLPFSKGVSQYDFFKKLTLTEEGYLKIINN